MNSMNSMDRMKQEQNRGYVIAGGAAIIAFIAFFLPYVTVSAVIISLSFSGASIGSWLWLEFLAVLVVIAASALFVFKNNLLSGTINMPLPQQIKYGKYLLLGGSILALLIHLIFLLNYSSAVAEYSSFVSLGFGYWLFMLAGIAMVVGSVLALRQPVAAIAQPYGQLYPPQPTQYPPYQNPYPTADQQPQQPYDPYQQPQQPYSPYQQPYPTADQQSQQTYPSYQQPYPTADQQPQQPYPPYQNPQQPQQYPPTEMQPPTQLR